MEPDAAARGDALLANMISLYKRDPENNSDLKPNAHVFNTLINCWSKSNDHDAASKAEELLIAMSNLESIGISGIKPDAFSYTAVIDAWAKSGHKTAASRAEALLNEMDQKFMSGDLNLKPTSYTYNAVIHALAKSGESHSANRAEKVLQNMVQRFQVGDKNETPTTINFNTVLGAWAKSKSGRAGAERAEKVLEWMDELHKVGYNEVKPDTISFNACIDAWARSGFHLAPERAEQILHHMDDLYASGNKSVKADPYSYNTVLNAWAKNGNPQRAERILSRMEKKFCDGDLSLKPNTRSYTTVIDAWAKSAELNAAKKAEGIFFAMQVQFEQSKDHGARPNATTANAVMNSCAFTKVEREKPEALKIAFRVFEWLVQQHNIGPDSYTYTIMLSVCANLLPRRDGTTRYSHAKNLFLKCREAGYVNDFVLKKLRYTITEEEYMNLVDYRVNSSARNLPKSWTRNAGKSIKGRGRPKARKN
jgi:pentatricopeptide repeat protein